MSVRSYVESLETRLEKMEKLLNKVRFPVPCPPVPVARNDNSRARLVVFIARVQLCPNADFTKELGGNFDREAWIADRERNGESSGAGAGRSGYGIPGQPSSSVIASPPALATPAGVDSDDLDPSDDEVIAQRNIVAKLQKMSVHPSAMRYHGKSSSLLFIQTAMDLKHEYAGVHLPPTVDPEAHNVLLRRDQLHWSLHPVRVRKTPI